MSQLNAELRKQTQDFVTSPAGEHFISKLDQLIAENHEKAENDGDKASQFTQRAKGVREAKQELIAMSVVLKEKTK